MCAQRMLDGSRPLPIMARQIRVISMLYTDYHSAPRWRRVTKTHDPHKRLELERRRHNKERNAEEQEKLVKRIMKRDERRRKRIKDAGIDYECPAFVGQIQPASKKIKFADEDAVEE
ncbi:hypothetical protein KSP40_PGU017107 [Platanthera guangdongensis]|uniref:Uncharacterized protein n=1 Tax=Platanthera guangdongensis TaxID=2320717 RepID=A0ABR2M5L4_9ASPA